MFRDCKTLEELKKTYHKLVMEHHPDRGGDLEMMKNVNVAYDKYFPLLKNKHFSSTKNEFYEKETKEAPEYFKDLINILMQMEGLVIEIVGCFVWVSGNTKPYKDALKGIGFLWHGQKVMWYLKPEDYHRRTKKPYAMDDIRNMYGSQRFETEEKVKLGA